MNILSQTDMSRPGSGCWIKEMVILCESCELYFVLSIQNISGWSDYKNVSIIGDPTKSKEKAIKTYKKYGGQYEDLG